jgi:xylulokinase
MFSIYKIAVGDAAWRPPAANAYRALSDFVATRWGAAPAIDWTCAARTGLFDIEAATWSAEMIATAAVDAPWMRDVPFSDCVPSGTPIGTVSTEAAERLRVPRATALVAGAHDQAASFIGAGGTAGSVSTFALGSSDCLTVETTQRPAGIAGTGFATYRWRSARWLTLAGTAAGGWTLDWYLALTSIADSDALLSELSPEPPPIIVLPYFAGSGTLDNDPTGRGAVLGLTLDVSRAQLTRAFLEAAGYELGSIVAAFTTAGLRVGQVRAVGAGANNPITLASAPPLLACPSLQRSATRPLEGQHSLPARASDSSISTTCRQSPSVPLPVPSPQPSIGTTSNDGLTATCTASSSPSTSDSTSATDPKLHLTPEV